MKKRRKIPPKDPVTGLFLPRLPKPPVASSPSVMTLDDVIVSKVDRQKLARVLLKKAYRLDSRAVEFVVEVLQRRIPPPAVNEYNTELLSEEELRVLLCLLEKARGKPVAAKHLASLCRALIFQLLPDAPATPAEMPAPVQPTPDVVSAPPAVPEKKPILKPASQPLAMPSIGHRQPSLGSYFASDRGDYDVLGEDDNYEEKPPN